MSEPELVERLRKLSAKATQGTWSWEDSPPTVYAGRVDPVGEFGGMPICGHGCNLFGRMTDISRNGRADLDFAVACVNFVRSNLDAIERLSRSDVTKENQVPMSIEAAEAIAFYADPENWHGVYMVGNGPMADDWSNEAPHPNYPDGKPGKRARAALEIACAAIAAMRSAQQS